VIVDSPIVYDDPENQTRWKPENYSEDFQGEVLLRTALVNSMNVPAIKTFIAVGIPTMTEWTKALGFNTPMNQDFSSALGSSPASPSAWWGTRRRARRSAEFWLAGSSSSFSSPKSDERRAAASRYAAAWSCGGWT
jgi:hypothetical protein